MFCAWPYRTDQTVVVRAICIVPHGNTHFDPSSQQLNLLPRACGQICWLELVSFDWDETLFVAFAYNGFKYVSIFTHRDSDSQRPLLPTFLIRNTLCANVGETTAS